MWILFVDLLEVAEQWKKRNGRYPSGDENVRWLLTLGFRWGGGDLFFSDADATESLYHGEITESLRLCDASDSSSRCS